MKHLLLFCLITLCADLHAQREDNSWLMGYRGGDKYPWVSYFPNGQDTAYLGLTRFDFNQTPRGVFIDSSFLRFDFTGTTMSDISGNLLFYTNGVSIGNSYRELIENGDSLNSSAYMFNLAPDTRIFGYRLPQGIMAFRNNLNPDLYTLIHVMYDTASTVDQAQPSKLLYTLLDMSANNGHGKVLQKNQTIIADTIGQEVLACRHTNGKDWWILSQERNTNCFYRILLDDSGPHLQSDKTCAGDTFNWHNITQGVFTPDGTKMAYNAISANGVLVYDFNRCHGWLSNAKKAVTHILDEDVRGMGVAISPNSRFLYVGATTKVYQFDLWSADLQSSMDTVAVFDGHAAPFGSYFCQMQLGPDGKIYESTGNAEYVMHVIDNPDEKGAACNFRQHGIRLMTYSGGLPAFPYYKLGAGPCYGVGLPEETDEREWLRFTNPVYGNSLLMETSLSIKSLQLLNTNGQVVYNKDVAENEIQSIEVPVANIPSGLYLLKANTPTGNLIKRLVIAH